jgi:hypothetical protein
MRGRGAPQLAGLVPAPLAVLALFTVLALFAAAAVAPAPAPASSVTPAVTPAGTWKLSSGRVYRWVALPGGVFEEQSMTSHTLAKSSCTLAAGTAVFRYKPVGGGVFAVYARRWTDACVASWEGEPKELLKIAVGSGRLKLSCDRAYTKACYSYTRVAAKPAPVRASTPAGTWKRDTGGTYRWVKRGSTWEETTLTSYTATGTKCRVAAGTLVYRYVPAGKGAYREQRRTWTKACRTGWKAGELLRLTPDASWLMHVQAADAADVWAGYARPGATPLPPSAGSPLGTWRIVAGRLYQWVAFGSGGFDELSLTPQRTDKGNCLIPRGTAVSRYTPLGGGVYDVSYRYWSDNCKTIAWDPPEERIKLVVRGNRLLFSCDRSYGELCWVGARVSG